LDRVTRTVPGISAFRDFVARARREPVLSILIFHRVLPESDPMVAGAVTQREFAQIAGNLRRAFSCYPLGEAVARLVSGTPGHMVAITFDDGYADNYKVALPVLRRYELPATVFVAARYLDGGIMWNDVVGEAISRTSKISLAHESLGPQAIPLHDIGARQQARKKVVSALKYLRQSERERLALEIARQLDVAPRSDLMLTSGQLKSLSAESLIEIGGHTYSHPILACTDETTAAEEMVRGKEVLEELTGRPVTGFAYPNGEPGRDYRPEHVRLAQTSGFSYAVSTKWGAARASADRFQLPRFTPWRRSALAFGAGLLKVARGDRK
jgi:peptidoglycan/xylan/chitin deacetylase (PgdA/CDA1 family)